MKLFEKVAAYGPLSLSDRELVQNIIGNTKKVDNLLKQYELNLEENADGDILRTVSLPFQELKAKGGLTDLEAARLMSAVELGVRIATSAKFQSINNRHTSSPEQIADYLMPRLRYLNHEVFGVIMLNSKNIIIATKIISVGTLNSSLVSTREIFASLLAQHCAAFVAFHNHPSGCCRPSREDAQVTRMLKDAGVLMEIKLLDHLVIGDGEYYSFQQEGEM